jgi:hypothetical protein
MGIIFLFLSAKFFVSDVGDSTYNCLATSNKNLFQIASVYTSIGPGRIV